MELKDNNIKIDNRGETNSDKDFVNKLPQSMTNGNNKFNLLVDCDEVLVDIGQKWMRKVIAHPYLSKYVTPDIKSLYDKGLINLRVHPYIDNLLKITKEDFPIWLSLYKDDPYFYDDLLPTPYMCSLVAMLPYIESITVLSKCPDSSNVETPVDISKKKFLLKYFKQMKLDDVKVAFHFIPFNESKADFVLKHNIKFNTFVDDNSDNIIDMVQKYPYMSYEILSPLLGYNSDLPSRLAKEPNYFDNKVSFQQFSNFEKNIIMPDDLIKAMPGLSKIKLTNNL